LLDSAREFGEDAPPNMDVDATEQWRDGVQEADFPEEEAVRVFLNIIRVANDFFSVYPSNNSLR
jgi:hypothetical protein